MNRKIKITFYQYGIVKAVIDNCQGIWDISNVCAKNSIFDIDILSIEWLMQPNENQIIDVSQPQ